MVYKCVYVMSVVCLLKIGIQTIRVIHSVCYPNYSNIENDIRFSSSYPTRGVV